MLVQRQENQEAEIDGKKASVANYFQVPQPMFDPNDKESVVQMVCIATSGSTLLLL